MTVYLISALAVAWLADWLDNWALIIPATGLVGLWLATIRER